MPIPVYAFTGFLDSGKTKFIQNTLCDTRFNAGERTLLLLCEEGEEEFDLSAYTKSVFSMFGGEATKVEIEFENSLAGVVFDKFGTDIPIIKSDDNHFNCHVNVAVSPQFLSWVMSFGNKAKIKSPESVVIKLKEHLSELNNLYKA